MEQCEQRHPQLPEDCPVKMDARGRFSLSNPADDSVATLWDGLVERDGWKVRIESGSPVEYERPSSPKPEQSWRERTNAHQLEAKARLVSIQEQMRMPEHEKLSPEARVMYIALASHCQQSIAVLDMLLKLDELQQQASKSST